MSVPPQARTRRCRAGRGPLWVKPRVFPKELPVGDFAFKSGEARAAPLPPAQGIPRAPRGAPEPKSWRGSHPGAGASLPRSGTAAGTARAPRSPGAGSGRDKGQRTRGRSSRARPCARSCRWRGRPSPVPGRQPALGTHGALRDLRQPPALPGELPGAALGSVGLSKRVVPVGTPLVWGPLPALPPRPGCGNLCGSCALHRPLRGQTRPDQTRPDQIRSDRPSWGCGEGEAVPGPGLRALPLGTFEVPSHSSDPACSTQSVPVWGAGGEGSQSGVSPTSRACLQCGAQQNSDSTGRFCGILSPGKTPLRAPELTRNTFRSISPSPEPSTALQATHGALQPPWVSRIAQDPPAPGETLLVPGWKCCW